MSPSNPREDDVWAAAVDDARLAPSSHNTQPWSFRRTEAGLDLVADGTRALTQVDPDFRELVISCGAALHHLRVALRAHGRVLAVETLPEGDDDPVLARLRLVGTAPVRPEDTAMARAIGERHTDRGHYAAETLPAAPFDELRTLAADEGATLTIVTDPAQRAAVGDLVEAGDRRQTRWPVFVELLGWIRLPGSHRDDGLPLTTLTGSTRRAERERSLVQAGPVVAVISTTHDAHRDWVQAGQALSAVLLGATARGLSASFFDAPVEEPDLRAEVGRAAGSPDMPQVLLRLGHGEGGPVSPRRPLAEVMS